MAIVDGKIRCSTCKEFKVLDEYQPAIARNGCGSCRQCKYESKRRWEQANPEKFNAAAKRRRDARPDQYRAAAAKWRRENPEKVHANNIRNYYGIEADEYHRRLDEQGRRCACCGVDSNGERRRFYVDHCHETGRIRGLLCHKRNSGIGALGDNVEGLKKALAYLERS